MIHAGMKEAHHVSGGRIYARNIGSLVGVAMKTGQSEILGNCPAAMLTGNDVIDLKRGPIESVGQAAILTGSRRSTPYFLLQGLSTGYQDHWPLALREMRALDCMRARRWLTRR